ncbi:hypothetical protein ABE41_013835 [Fictibacillus arsenicus]|uniref:Uncharacterized protein n=1 Tax=Fictibacillus arsenicus TaxID=255247 RepID=A0A1B1Z6J3_9BACL|nr:hypothetical protein ABE41_013835 [Fictibacillus arsenicus]
MVRSAKEAHRTPRGKRASWNGNQPLQGATKFAKTTFLKNKKSPIVLKDERTFPRYHLNLRQVQINLLYSSSITDLPSSSTSLFKEDAQGRLPTN